MKEATVGGNMAFTVFIVFLVLKLCHVIDWSWWWITCPLWGVFAFLIVILLAVLILSGFIECFLFFGKKKNK